VAFAFARLIYEIFLLHKKVWLPLFIDSSHKMPDESNVVWPARHRKKFQARFLRRSVALFVVALHAGADKIFPAFVAAAGSWNNVVDSERQISAPAILATVAVAPQNIFPGENNAFVRDPVKNRETKYARHRQRRRDGTEDSSIIPFNKFCLPQVKQDDRLFPTTNSKRFVILI
jgi:hypothetical protein